MHLPSRQSHVMKGYSVVRELDILKKHSNVRIVSTTTQKKECMGKSK